MEDVPSTPVSSVKRILRSLGITDLILVYFIFMNYIIVVPAVFLGLSVGGIISYFRISLVILLFSFPLLLVIIVSKRKCIRKAVSSQMHLRNASLIFALSVILLWLAYEIIVALYTPIFVNYDAMAIYMPMAEAIRTTGSLLYNPFYLSAAQMGRPPLSPILYAFTISTVGESYIKIVPIIYLAILLILIYKFGSEFFGRNVAILSAFLFLVLPSTQTYLGGNSLYLDLAFTFYFLAAVYFLVKCFRDSKGENIWYLLLGLASGLLFLSKETGVFLFFPILSLAIFFKLMPVKNIYLNSFLASCVAFFPYALLSVSDLVTIGVANYYIQRTLLVLAFFLTYFAVLVLISKRFHRNPVSNVPLKLVLSLIPAGLSTAYMIYDVIVLGQVSTWTFRIASKLAEAGIMMPSSANIGNSSSVFLDPYNFFITFPMVLLFVPLLTSLLLVFNDLRKKRLAREIVVLLLFFVYLFFMWGFGGFPIGSDTFRELIPLSIVSCILIGYYWARFQTGLERTQRFGHQFQFVLITLAFAYTWFFVEKTHPEESLFTVVVNSNPNATFLDLLILTCIYVPYIISFVGSRESVLGRLRLRLFSLRHRFKRISNHKSKVVTIFFFLVLTINILMPSYLILRSSNIISRHGWNPAYYAQVGLIEAFTNEPLIEISDFYKTKLNDSYVTITYGMQRLTYLLKRPFIDLNWMDQVYILSPILKSKDPNEITSALIERNFRYFLLPIEGNSLYSIFSSWASNFELFSMVEQQQNLTIKGQVFSYTLLQEFKDAGADLYELRTQNVTALKHYYSFQEKPILISDDDQSKLYTSTTQNISLSDALLEDMRGKNALQIEISPFTSYGEYIIYRLESSIDISQEDFISFFWYGNNSGTHISLRLFTGDWRNQYEFVFIDSWKGWARLIVPLSYFSVLVGLPKWNQIDAVSFIFHGKFEQETTFYLDQLTADTGVYDLLIIPLQNILSPQEYEEQIKELAYYFNFENNPSIISDDNQSRVYKSATSNISITDNSQFKIKGNNALKIEVQPYSSKQQEYIRYAFQSPTNFSNRDFISFYWYGNNSGNRLALRLETGDWRNQYEFVFIDSWKGWARLIVPLSYFSVLVGSPSWNDITAVSFNFYEKFDIQAVFYLDRLIADNGQTDFHFVLLKN